MKRLLPFIILALTLGLSSCSSEIDKAASLACECFTPYADLEEKRATIGTDSAAIAAFTEEETQVGIDTEACILEMDERYADRQEDFEFQDAVIARLEKTCPRVYAIRQMGGFE